MVSPDYESPGRFRPVPPPPPGGGEAPELPERPLEPPKLTASYGAWLYVSTARGLFAFDTVAPPTGAPTAQLLTDAVPRWIGVDGSTLNVIASAVSDDPDAAERGLLTRLYRFELSNDPGSPELLGSVEVAGRLARARLDSGRLIVLGVEYPEPGCDAMTGITEGNWSPPERYVVSDFRLQGAAWSLADSAGVEAQGFIETKDAFLLVRGGYFGIPAVLTAVEIGAEGLTASPSVSVGGEVLPRAAMALEGQRLALFQNPEPGAPDAASGVELKVFSMVGGAPQKMAVDVPSLHRTGDGIDAAHFSGRFALVPWVSTESSQPGVIIDWQAEPAPTVTGELPADIPYVRPIGERWLAWGAERSVVFRVGAEGTFDVEHELGPPAEGGAGVDVHWDAGAQRATLPYAMDVSGSVYQLAILDLASPAPAWRAGPRTTGRPQIAYYDSIGHAFEALQLERTVAGWFALTERGDFPGLHQLLEALDVEGGASDVIGFAERTIGASLSASGSAELLADHRGTRAVRVSAVDGRASHIPLGFGAEHLVAAGDGWVSYSLGYSNACSDPEMFADPTCLPSGVAALSQISADPPRLVHDTELPLADTLGTPPAATREWLEISAQGDEVGLLAHRDIRCTSDAECDALGVPPAREGGNVRNQNQRWLHPYDRTAGDFRAPVRLPDTNGYGWLSASGLRTEEQPAFIWLDPREIAADGYSVVRARIQLVRFPSLLAASSENMERITVPGFPVFASKERAVSIEPAGVLDASGKAVGTLVHHLALRGGAAFIEQTLELPSGRAGHLWAKRRGYVLLIGDDRCAETSATVVSVRLNGELLEEAGRLELPGTNWKLAQASDELVLLTREIGGVPQHALIGASGGELSLRGYETRPSSVPSVFGDAVWFAPRNAPSRPPE